MMKKFSVSGLVLENLVKAPVFVQTGCMITLFFFILLSGYMSVLRTNLQQYEILKQQTALLKQAFEQKQSQAARINAYRKQQERLKQYFHEMSRVLSTQDDLPDLLEDIIRYGMANRLTFELLSPQPEIQGAFYIEQPINIIMRGSYREMVLFLSQMTNVNRIVTWHDFILEDACSTNDKSCSTRQLILKITAKIYRQRL